MLALFFCGEFLFHILYWLFFFLICGVSLTHPMLASFLSGEFLLHVSSWLYVSVGSFYYTSCAGFSFFNLGSFSDTSHHGFKFIWGVSLTHPVVAAFLYREFLLHIPCWLLLFSWEFLLHIPYWLYFYLGSFSYTSCAGFTFLWGVFLPQAVLNSFF